MYLKGSADDYNKDKINNQIKQRYNIYQKKKKILDIHYQKSINTIHVIKKYLEDIFQEIGIDN